MPKKALTDAAIKAIKPPEKGQVDYFDQGYPGLSLRISHGNTRTFVYYYRYRGRSRRLTLGTYPSTSLAEAHEQWRELRDHVRAGKDPAAEQKAEKEANENPDRDLFENVARDFIDRYAKPKNRTWKETARILGFKVAKDGTLTRQDGPAKLWRDWRIQEITRRDVVALIDDIETRAPIAAKNTFAALRKMFNWAVSKSIIETSPCAGAQAPAPARARDRVLTPDELLAVWKAVPSLGHPFAGIYQLLILTGQRREEVSGMEWKEVDLDAKLWRIPASRMKKDRPQDVPLSDAAMEVLEPLQAKRIKDCDLVFSTNGKTAPSGFSKAKRRLDALAPLDPWRTHDLRRSLASGMAQLGISLPVIEKILAHESGSFGGIVGVYQRHSFFEEKKQALEAWGRYVMTLDVEAAGNVVELRGT